MVKYLFLLVTLIIFNNAYPQSADSGEFQNFPETSFFIKLPPGFQETPVVSAFEDASKNSILLIPYTDSARAGKAAEDAEGMIRRDSDISFERVIIDGNFKGPLRISPEDQLMNRIAGFFTNGNVAFLILGSYNRSDSILGAKLVAAIKTIRYDQNFRIQPNPHTPFLLDDTNSPFKFLSSVMGAMFTYQTPGPTDSVTFIVSVIPLFQGNEMNEVIKDLRIPLPDAVIKNESYQPVNNFRTYTRELYSKASGRPVACFQRLVEVSTCGILMEGFAANNIEQNMQLFSELASTIRKNPAFPLK